MSVVGHHAPHHAPHLPALGLEDVPASQSPDIEPLTLRLVQPVKPHLRTLIRSHLVIELRLVLRA